MGAMRKTRMAQPVTPIILLTCIDWARRQLGRTCDTVITRKPGKLPLQAAIAY